MAAMDALSPALPPAAPLPQRAWLLPTALLGCVAGALLQVCQPLLWQAGAYAAVALAGALACAVAWG
ncbi:hypothetical protein B2J88_52210, partial [Rhodococcus sp. SRB_17]|nr:hypothetical protein [Rhodococcus sp. SRB_17]